MNKASSKAYVSKSKMDRYREEKAKLEARIAAGEAIDEEMDYQSSGDEKAKEEEKLPKQPQQQQLQQPSQMKARGRKE